MADGEKHNLDIYRIQGLSPPTEMPVATPESSDIFAIKKENTDRLGSLIGIVLSEGVFLCNAYRLDKKVSHDEMGETWKASYLQESRNVIVYLPPLEIRKDESATEQVKKNARRVEALDHPRIIPTLDNFTDPEHGFFIVRKFVGGKTLDVYRQDYVKRHKNFTPIKAVKMLNDLSHALDYAHGIDIIHGALCPKSIVVGLDGEVYLDHFVLFPVQANIVSTERKPYQSPETYEGCPTTVYSDIYSLAVIAYELFSGRLPNSLEMDSPFPIPNVPSTVDAVIRKAMARIPDDRYDSSSAFTKALESSFQESQRIKTVIVFPPSKLSIKKVLANTLLWALALALFCIGFYGFVYFDVVRTRLVGVMKKPAESVSNLVVPMPEIVIKEDDLATQDDGKQTCNRR